jgi:hypothetical protein
MEAQRVVLELNVELAKAKGIVPEKVGDAEYLPVLAELLAQSSFSEEDVELDPSTANAMIRFTQLDIQEERPVKRLWPAQRIETPVVKRTLVVTRSSTGASRGQLPTKSSRTSNSTGPRFPLLVTNTGALSSELMAWIWRFSLAYLLEPTLVGISLSRSTRIRRHPRRKSVLVNHSTV